ncbi:hypothetical protein PAECIP111893_01144 [Paenibacillus plantiphilus]|uniref:Uncharacterized protein n=1 Tax=Paenibacillus plantiphilus TaxID=2905650 RepID=A0ABM9BYV5_9BACL|nr:hypothetical protein [Paenibacillus plantiphilus]CAH1198872.1 hypothetical protein PAECIP111893_01144 [Paenibacillus plantiphilus]
MRFEEFQINQWLESITVEEQAAIKGVFSKQYNVNIVFSPEGLASLDIELLVPLRDCIRGLVLTKTRVPNMIDEHALRSKKLSRKIEFGAVRDSEE